MAFSYTPGLKVTEKELIVRRRMLPLKGEVLVQKGDQVNSEDIIARTLLPGKIEIINVANKMGIDQGDVPSTMTKKEGEFVHKGQIIAETKSLFGLFKSNAIANFSGTIESISSVTGQVVLRGAPQSIEINAYLKGKVTEIISDLGIAIESWGTLIQGIFGIGGETSGKITMASNSPDEIIDENVICQEHRGKIIIGGSLVTGNALKLASQIGIRGIVVGGFDDQDLRDFLGYDLGVAITGHENLGVTVIATEGFGKINMAPRTFELLLRNQGQLASINGTTQIRAGVIRPEVIIPGTASKKDILTQPKGLDIGNSVRVIRNPYFGQLGTVIDLPMESSILDSGSKARVVLIQLDNDNRPVLVPRANVEILEDNDE